MCTFPSILKKDRIYCAEQSEGKRRRLVSRGHSGYEGGPVRIILGHFCVLIYVVCCPVTLELHYAKISTFGKAKLFYSIHWKRLWVIAGALLCHMYVMAVGM